jgi:hypothetical protein
VRLGIRGVSVQKGTARLVGLVLKESQKVRLRRLVPKAVVKESAEVVVPVATNGAEVAEELIALLSELVPDAQVVSAGP